MDDFRAHTLQTVITIFRKQKASGESAMSQLSDEQLFATLDPEMNSVAVIVKHMRGNMRSRWTDLLTTDGEKPDRERDEEFVAPSNCSRAQVLEWWEEGWRCVFAAITPLTAEQVQAPVTIRREPMTVLAAMLRQVDHYGQHVGQIVFLAKHLRGAAWTTLSIPRGKSAEYLARPAVTSSGDGREGKPGT